MRKKLICLLVAGALPGAAFADSTSAQIKALQQQLNALQKEVKELRAQVATAPAAKPAVGTATTPALAAAPADITSPDYGRAPANISNDDLTTIKQQIANQPELEFSNRAHVRPLSWLKVSSALRVQ